MTKKEFYPAFDDYFEYHGGTTIEMTRKQSGTVVLKKWLLFDSVEEAMEFFNISCGI